MNSVRRELDLAYREPTKLPWIVSARFDMLFLANLGWLLLLLPGFSTSNETVVDFWQVHFLTLPHRWITLLLVLIDKDRRERRAGTLLSIAVLGALVVLGTYLGSGVFLCLGLIDYIWNSWHFASQHSGILRIYSRKRPSGIGWLEKWGLRVFIVFAILRTSGSLLWYPESIKEALTALAFIDYLMLSIPAFVLLTNIQHSIRTALPKLIYLISVVSLYSGYLLAGHLHADKWILCFASSASLFHAVEYLAIIHHYMVRKQGQESKSILAHVAGQWSIYFVFYIVSLGCMGLYCSEESRGVSVLWQGLNLWAAFSHYAFDGLIWKLRKPETARSLGAIEP